MKYIIESLVPNYMKEFEFDNSDVLSQEDYKEMADSIIHDHLYDVIEDAYNSYEIKAFGNISVEEAREYVARNAINYIEKIGDTFEIALKDEKSNEITRIDIKEYFKDIIKEESECGEFDLKVSGYVEACLLSFVDKGVWHFNADKMWYGIDEEEPVDIWTINLSDKGNIESFWFLYDSYEIMENLNLNTDYFLTWYLAECGCAVPDLERIREKSPVMINEDDTLAEIRQRVLSYLK